AHDVPLGCAPDEYDDLISGTCSHLPYILDHNVGFIQGYLYAKPMCSSDFTRWLDTRANEQNDRIKCKKCSINQ
ncbi:hypothetical protein, partial [Klebsiella pneumoniae]